MFARSLTDDLASLVKQIDKKVAENDSKQMAGFVVLLTDDPDQAEKDVKEFGQKHGIKHVPLTIYDGVAGPPNYKIAKDAEVTVSMWVNLESKANHAFAEGELDEAKVEKVVADTGKILK